MSVVAFSTGQRPREAFLEALATVDGNGDQEELDSSIESFLARARLAHPDLLEPGDDAALLRHVASVLPVAEDTRLAQALDTLRAEDLLLAFACARGNLQALRRFEETILPALQAPLRRMRVSEHQAEDLTQQLRQRLFVAAPDRPAKIGAYAGRGPLTAWLRVVGVREALAMLEREKKHPGVFEDDVWAALPAPGEDIELNYLKERYRDQFKLAFRDATEHLESRERLLLRQSFVDGLTMDEIALVFGAHRKTVSRWLAKARETLLRETRKLLQQRLQIDRAELDSILRRLDSELEISIPSILLAAKPDEP